MTRGDGKGSLGETEQSLKWYRIHTSRERRWQNWWVFLEAEQEEMGELQGGIYQQQCEERRRLGDDWKSGSVEQKGQVESTEQAGFP